jgi:hypothetical protein
MQRNLIFVALLLLASATSVDGKEEWCSAEVDSTSVTIKASGRWGDLKYQLGYVVGVCTDSSSSQFGTFVAVVNGVTQRQTVGLSGTIEFPGNASVSFLLNKPQKGPQYFSVNISYGGNDNFTAVLCDNIYSGVVGPCVVDSMLPVLIVLLWVLPGVACGLFLAIAYVRKNRYDRQLLLKEREANIKQGWQSPIALRQSTSEQHLDQTPRNPPCVDGDDEDELKSRQSTVRYYEHPLDGTLRPKKGGNASNAITPTESEAERELAERQRADAIAAEYLIAQQLDADRQVALSKTLAALRIESERLEAECEDERRVAQGIEIDQTQAERLTAALIENELLESERLEAEEAAEEAEKAHQAQRKKAELLEAERAKAERIEAERIEAQRLEAERLEAERLEAERIEAERREAERIEAERIEAERIAAERLEAERIAADRLEAERLEAERIAAERIEADRIAAERIEAERLEAERIAAERLGAERIEAERIAAERIEAERIEAERIEAERIEAERIDAERVEAERIEAERIEADRIEAERVEAERIEAERLEAERLEAERIETERLEAERIEAERIEAERLEAERLEAERIEAERIEAERIEADRLEAERIEAERLEADRLEAERLEAERIEAERLEADRLEAERLEAERIEAERQDEAERQEAARAIRKLEEDEMLAASVSYNAEYRDLMMMLQKPDAKERAKAFLGFSLAESVEEGKLIVDGVYRDGPAFQVGVRMEDSLTHIAGAPVCSIQDARVAVAKHCRPAELAALTFLRPTGDSYTVKLWVMTAEPRYRGKAYFFDTETHVKDQSPRPKHRQNSD